MRNEGLPGEFVSDGTDRLRSVLAPAQVLLLMEGANDMNQINPPIDSIAADLRAMVRDARSRQMSVFLGTVIPQRQRACRGYDFCHGVEHTVLLNERIRSIAEDEGVTLVDLYSAFGGKTDTLLGIDGLHPNEAGYRTIANLFFDTIRQKLETR